MIVLRLKNRREVHLVGTMNIPLPISAVWGQMRCFTEFVGLDPFHGPIRTSDGSPADSAGKIIILGHRFGPLHLDRIGKILLWKEGVGYSFSDLSRGGNHAGFPHVFTYKLSGRNVGICRLTIIVRGEWTATFLPSILIRRWLIWVLGHTMHTVRNRLLAIALIQKDGFAQGHDESKVFLKSDSPGK